MYPQSLSPVQQVDFALFLIFAFSFAVLLILTCITIYFLIRYNHKRNPTPSDIHGNVKAELLWTIIPTMMVMGLFYFGWTGYKALRSVPDGAMQVEVTAKMFSWTFTYPNGKKSATLTVPVGKPVQLNLHSVDVIHSFFVPAFRIKMDCVPNMPTYAWFQADKEGEYDIYCAEYCGLKHAAMLSLVKAVSQEEFDTWYNDTKKEVGPEAGQEIMDTQGCFGCHSIDGTSDFAPSFKGLYGAKTIVIEKGKEIEKTVDDQYIKDSIAAPEKDIVKGFDNTMPAYEMTDEEIQSSIEYLKSIGADIEKMKEAAASHGAAGADHSAHMQQTNGSQSAPAHAGAMEHPAQ